MPVKQQAGFGFGQPLYLILRRQIGHQADRGGADGVHSQDTDATHLEQSGQDCGRAGHHPAGRVQSKFDLIVGDKFRAAVDQAERQIRFAAS